TARAASAAGEPGRRCSGRGRSRRASRRRPSTLTAPSARTRRKRRRAGPRRGAPHAMNFELTDDQRRIRDAGRGDAEGEIAPGVAEREARQEFPREVLRGLAEMGILGMMVPEEYGGAGADALSYILAVEELARVCASTAVIVSVNNSVV